MKLFLTIILFLSMMCPTFLQAQDFYGVKFGMLKPDVEKIFMIDSQSGLNQVKDPGHGMHSLFFHFDNNNRLYYIEAYYSVTNNNEENEALSLALNSKFIEPVKKLRLQQEIDVKIDTYKRAGEYNISEELLILKMSSKPIRGQYVRYLKESLLKKME